MLINQSINQSQGFDACTGSSSAAEGRRSLPDIQSGKPLRPMESQVQVNQSEAHELPAQ
jgi:hypothetical protein